MTDSIASPTSQSGLYIPSYCALGDHPKIHKLSRLLGISRVTAVGHMQFFWWWAMSYAPDGSLERFDCLDIAIAAQWEGDEQEFVDALVAVGFIDESGIHDWPDFGGKVLKERQKNAEKMAQWRQRKRDESATEQDGNDHVTVTLPSRDRIREEKSREEKKRKDTPPLPPDPNGATAPPAADYRSLIGDDYWSALDAFREVDPALSNGWLDKALKRAPPGLSPDRLFQALENALNRVGEDFHRNESQQFIKSKYGWANTIVDEEFADAQRTTP